MKTKTIHLTEEQASALKALICDYLNDLGIVDFPEEESILTPVLKQLEDALQLKLI